MLTPSLRPCLGTLSNSDIRIECLIEIDGQNAETEGERDFAKQHDRSSWSGLSGVERLTLVQRNYRSSDDAFPQDKKGLPRRRCMERLPAVRRVDLARSVGGDRVMLRYAAYASRPMDGSISEIRNTITPPLPFIRPDGRDT